ncbi:hypothetical protein MO973_30350 [Paenibacillus sp. TRM 82003]|uniref:hypothetical protein n=1 Tax=Kineococcus sp. TRM81007 TaxID=2925831 RepID=UPI001F579667|nr:hypothetical protein [Kineococcus sp. TRM81007]MCI2239106.1 hypothetical protein [Kineococcus sp. TRM81007]MCI3924525.1 hypothetical protein [Paenibacillus sp. TRM 82003]
MAELHIGEELRVDGTAHTVVALDGGTLTLRSITGAERRCSAIDLFAFHDVEPVRGKGQHLSPVASMVSLPTVSAATLDEARFWEMHVADLLLVHDDRRSASEHARDAQATSMRARSIAKAQALTAGHPISDRHLRRMCQRYQQHGLWGLIDQRSTRRSSPTGRIDPRGLPLLQLTRLGRGDQAA